MELRELIAANLKDRYGVTYDPRTELLITVGASEGVDASLRATLNPGDEVIYHEPCFVAYAPCIELAGGTAVAVSTTDATDFRVTAGDDRARPSRRAPRRSSSAIRTTPPVPCWTGRSWRPSPRSPSDTTCSCSATRSTTGWCTASTSTPPSARCPGCASARVLLGGFSKSYAMTGWRIGYVAAPAELMSGIAKVHQYGIMCAPTPAQFAAIEALRSGEPHVQSHARRIRPPPPLHDRSLQPDRPGLLRADGCLLLLPARDRCDRPRRRQRSPRSCSTEERVGRGARRRVRAERRGPRSGLLRHRVRGDRRGHGPHRAVRRSPPSVTLQRAGGAAGFSASADDYAATMAPALAPVAARGRSAGGAARRGRPCSTSGTGTGTAAALARGEGRRVIGLDAAAGMLEIARREVPDVEFIEADFTDMPMPDGAVDVVIAVHALLFADDRVARCASGCGSRAPAVGSRSRCPGRATSCRAPCSATSTTGTASRGASRLPDCRPSWRAGPSRRAGPTSRSTADPTHRHPAGGRGRVSHVASRRARGRAHTASWPAERREQFARDLMAAAPRDADGAFWLPFGALYLTATNR